MSTLKVNTLTKADGTTFPFDYPKLFSGSGTSGGAALVFDNLDITTYKAFDFICTFIPNSDNRNCSFQFRSGGASGADIDGANYTYGADGQYPTHNEQIIARSGETHFEIAENVGADTEEGIHMDARIHFATSNDPGDLARLTNRIFWNANYRVHTTAFRNIIGCGVYDLNDTTYPTGFKVSFIGANIDAYTYCLYGIKR